VGLGIEALNIDDFNVASTNTLLSHYQQSLELISDQTLSQLIYIDMEVYDMSRTRSAIIPRSATRESRRNDVKQLLDSASNQ
jgi:hypothetical protein